MAYDLTARLQLKDSMSGKMKKVTKQLGKTDKTAGKMTKTFKAMDKAALAAGAGVAAAFATAGTAVINAGLDAQEAQKNIVAGTGATGDALDDLMASYREVGSQVPQELGQVSQAIANMNTLTGATGGNLEGMTKAVLDASRMMNEEGSANVQTFGRALNQWQIPAEQGEQTAAKLFQVAQNTGVGFGELASHMTEYGSVLKNAGFSADEAASLFGNLEQSGLSVSRLMPGLNMAFRNWSKEGKNAQDELANTIERMQEAGSSTKALSIATDEFGAEGAQRLVTAVENGTLSLEDLGSGLDNAMQNMQKSNEASKTFGQRWSETMNSVNTALQPVGKAILDVAEDYMPGLQQKAGEMADYIKSNMPEIKQSIEDFANRAQEVIGNVTDKATEFADKIKNNWPTIKNTVLTLSGAFVTLRLTMLAMMIVSTITKLMYGLQKAIKVTRTAMLFLNAAMYANPIGAVIAVVAALTLGLVYLYRNFDTVRDKAKDMWTRLSNAFKTGVNYVIGLLNDLIGALNSALSFELPDWLGGRSFSVDIPEIPEMEHSLTANMAQESGQSPMASGVYDKSAYHGLDHVPYDGMRINAHKDEAVLPADEAAAYRAGKSGDGGGNTGGGSVTITGNTFNLRDEGDIDRLAKSFARELRTAQEGGA